MATYLSAAETSKIIRKALKASFPEQKFSVRSGNSIRVNWIDGPNQQAVDAVVQRFAGSDMDSMQDMAVPRSGFEWEGNVYQTVADFVFTNRDLSPERIDELTPAAAEAVSACGYSGEFERVGKWYEGVPTAEGFFTGGYGINLIHKMAEEMS